MDSLPLPAGVKLLGVGVSALALAGLPLWEKAKIGRMKAENHHHHHHHEYEHHHPHEHDHHHDHEHGHHHHDHGHSHGPAPATAYAPKGLALAASVAYPVAAIALNGADPLGAVAQALAASAAGAVALSATTAESDYLLGVEAYRGYNLDWLIPLGLAAATSVPEIANRKSQIENRKSVWRWLPLAAVALAAWRNLGGQRDLVASLDREHRHAHTHHLSAFQRNLGDVKMALSPKPLRKWALLAPLGVVAASILKQNQQDDLAAVALTAAAAGQVATLAGFRNGQRPLLKTLEGRAKGWAVGAVLAGMVWLIFSFLKKR
jgi:hypothetical protein